RPAEHVESLRALFAEARRVLADDGTLWLNLGDSYASGSRTAYALPGKNLLGIPWRVAFALQDDGWILRNDIIWSKPNAMPESVVDRLATKHEHVFMFSKSRRYWFDLDPIRAKSIKYDTPGRGQDTERGTGGYDSASGFRSGGHVGGYRGVSEGGRNPGDVWTIATQPYPGAHFAVMPVTLAERCIR